MISRPANKEELYNLRHASARNVVERIFGILKRRFRILLLAPEYCMDIQARIPPALCAIHNFIRIHDPQDIENFADVVDGYGDEAGSGTLAEHAVTQAEKERAGAKRDAIANQMWEDYQALLRERGEMERDNRINV